MPQYRALIEGGFFSKDPKDQTTPRAIRTNNPGALNTAAWVKKFDGFVEQQLDSVGNNTAVFEAPEFGVAAWWTLLRKYSKRFKPENFHLKNIITRYSGGNSDVASSYIAFVSAKAGLGAKMPVDLFDDHAMLSIARAFFHYEAGRASPLSDEQITFGFRLAQEEADPSGVIPQPSTSGSRAKLVDIAVAEASKELSWDGAESEAEKYLKPLRAPMRALGHIGTKPVFYDWCAAFVTWVSRKAGYQIPDQPAGFWATMALVESWRYWGKKTGYGAEVTGTNDLEPGDIVLFEWFDGDTQLDHIGIFIQAIDSDTVKTAEGNKGNSGYYGARNIANIKYRVRLP